MITSTSCVWEPKLSNSEEEGNRHQDDAHVSPEPKYWANPTALDEQTYGLVEKRLQTSVRALLGLRSHRSEQELLNFLPAYAAGLFRDALGEEAVNALLRREDDDRLTLLLSLLKIAELFVGWSFDENPTRLCREDVVAIADDLRTILDRQPKDGPPFWLLPRGNERSNPLEVEHRRRAVIWHKFILVARESTTTAKEEVRLAFGISTKTLNSWINELSSERGMMSRLDAATGTLDSSGRRIAAIYDGSRIHLVWMKQRHDHFGRGESGHYQTLLIEQANEYRSLTGRKFYT